MTTERENQYAKAGLELLQTIYDKLEAIEARGERQEQMQRSTLAILNRTPFDGGKAKEP